MLGLDTPPGNVGDVGVERVDPRGVVCILGAVDNAEDGAFAVGGTRQERDVGGVLAGGEAGCVV